MGAAPAVSEASSFPLLIKSFSFHSALCLTEVDLFARLGSGVTSSLGLP